jgi:hypothetical protein
MFALDAKNWRGIASANGKGELLLTAHFEKPQVRPFVERVMGIRDSVKALAPEMDAYRPLPSTQDPVHCPTI